jgi:hypothetical protein
MNPVYQTTGLDRRRRYEERAARAAQNWSLPALSEHAEASGTTLGHSLSNEFAMSQPQHVEVQGPVHSTQAFVYSPDTMSNATHGSPLSMDWDNFEQIATTNPFTGTIDVVNEETRVQTNPFLTDNANLELDNNDCSSAYLSVPRLLSRPLQPLHMPVSQIPQGRNPFLVGYSEQLSGAAYQAMQSAHARAPAATAVCTAPCHPHYPQPYVTPTPREMSKSDRTVVTELMKRVQNVDGSDEFAVVQFLKALKPILDIVPSFELEVIKLLTPKVTGQLFEIWIQAISSGVNWEILHLEILDRFIPALRRREIEILELDRPMRTDETFSDYCEHVIAAAFALNTRLTEGEIIEIVLSKCRPHVKTHFVFGTMPQTLAELRSLAYKVTSSVRAESRYFGNGPSPNVFNVQNASRPVLGRNIADNFPQPVNNVFDNRPARTTRVVVCHKCNNEGHIARNCRMQNLNSR